MIDFIPGQRTTFNFKETNYLEYYTKEQIDACKKTFPKKNYRLYRGLAFSSIKNLILWVNNEIVLFDKNDTKANIITNALTSWTTDREIAEGHYAVADLSIILAINVSYRNIFCRPPNDDEELLLLPGKYTCDIVYNNFKTYKEISIDDDVMLNKQIIEKPYDETYIIAKKIYTFLNVNNVLEEKSINKNTITFEIPDNSEILNFKTISLGKLHLLFHDITYDIFLGNNTLHMDRDYYLDNVIYNKKRIYKINNGIKNNMILEDGNDKRVINYYRDRRKFTLHFTHFKRVYKFMKIIDEFTETMINVEQIKSILEKNYIDVTIWHFIYNPNEFINYLTDKELKKFVENNNKIIIERFLNGTSYSYIREFIKKLSIAPSRHQAINNFVMSLGVAFINKLFDVDFSYDSNDSDELSVKLIKTCKIVDRILKIKPDVNIVDRERLLEILLVIESLRELTYEARLQFSKTMDKIKDWN